MFTFPHGFWSAPPSGGGGGSGGYINSVQHVSITIPTGAVSATATISSVGSYAFIVSSGSQTSAVSNTIYGYARVELTNSTTITAYRNSSTALYTVTVKCCVVDATSSLIASVQTGVVTIGASSTTGTATISSTNSSYTVLHCLGCTSTQSTLSYGALEPLLSYSGTTLTATRYTSASNTVDVGYVVIEFQSAACNQAVQGYQKSWTNTSTSTTQSITSVDPNKTMLFHAGNTGNVTNNGAAVKQHAVLTNGTTVTITTNSASSIACLYNFYVVEFASGVLNSNVQRGTTAMSAVNSNTSTISSVTTAMSVMNSMQFITSQTSTNMPGILCNAVLTNSTTVTANRHGTSGNSTISWEVVEFS